MKLTKDEITTVKKAIEYMTTNNNVSAGRICSSLIQASNAKATDTIRLFRDVYQFSEFLPGMTANHTMPMVYEVTSEECAYLKQTRLLMMELFLHLGEIGDLPCSRKRR